MTVPVRATLLALACFVVFNANLRELGTYDSQPPKFLAREILLRHTLTLDRTIAELPPLAQRPGFVKAPDGHYRPAYSIVPALAAAVVGWPLVTLHLIDLDGPLSANLIAKLTASLLASLAVGLSFLTARRYTSSDLLAALVAIGFGLGTNVWALASQTLWQHESVLAGLALAVWALARPTASRSDAAAPSPGGSALWLASFGLGIAGWARPQTAVAIAVLAVCLLVRRAPADANAHGAESPRKNDAARGGPWGWGGGVGQRALALLPLVVCGALALWLNIRWFGHPLGATPILESLHSQVHAVPDSLSREPVWGAIGLLFSPSRGVVIFSPIVAIALLSLSRAWREGLAGTLLWFWIATIGQFVVYALYSVWWGGHTYGPRYPIDLLPLLVPLAAAGAVTLVRTRVGAAFSAIALAWSILIAGTGAWCYPADAWNTDPNSVDQHHERLWDWKDTQWMRCWKRGASPQNYSFLEPDAFRAPATPAGR